MVDEAPVAVEGQAVAPNTDNGQAQVTKPWYDGFAPETIGYIQNKGWDAPVKAIEAYKQLEGFHGVPADRLLKLPKEGESYDAVYDRLGRPQSPDKYELKLEGAGLDEARINLIKDVAHKAGLNTNQLQALAEADAKYFSEAVAKHNEAITQQQEIEYDNLIKEWGEHASEREELARRFIRSNMPEGVDKAEMLTKIENAIGTAAMLKLFANAGSKGGEDRLPNNSDDRPYGYTKEQAQADKAQLMSEIKVDAKRLDTYNRGSGPDFDKMNRLNSIISGR